MALIVDGGGTAEGNPLPSVRSLARQFGVNPLTVGKAYATLQEQGIVQAQAGVGFFVVPGGADKLKVSERARFLREDWPEVFRAITMLGISPSELTRY